MGRWLKGRLAAAGLVNPVNDTQADTDRAGMITKEMLEEYGCDNLYLKKTGQTAWMKMELHWMCGCFHLSQQMKEEKKNSAVFEKLS